ncbi:glucose-1-phosphate cytidylyltransferase [Polynucleobacter sp. Adler-ghost]|uniref:glucose-1-phosphate cytidylyltransferase n=1 Tax=Polynucleobacter sp. Adler-ghost TaxID=2770234 RepID=UPI001BFDA1BE|nr:glucose-1-phosphate cytidylyltransferase [Polynucleobacter sp. Adler-ghost]QWE31061.1 glucose-1-phosphate cytidylyltransferase [Polynucleobacter sp. Adler-ghost]
MKTVILAGGFGTRLSEYTELIPKPMVEIGGVPILIHIMNLYAHYGHKDFYLALGYKANLIKQYFLNLANSSLDFTIELKDGKIIGHNSKGFDWKVTLVDTGVNSMTGGRLKRLKDYLGNEPFFLTYGDGLSNININELAKFHSENKRLVTVSAVRPIARFGELSIDPNGTVRSFKEKPQIDQGWINGGYFVIDPKFIDLIQGDDTVLEKEPLERAAEMGELVARRHQGFWQCMDTKRDLDALRDEWDSGGARWRI